jgi:hypothetical protein
MRAVMLVAPPPEPPRDSQVLPYAIDAKLGGKAMPRDAETSSRLGLHRSVCVVACVECTNLESRGNARPDLSMQPSHKISVPVVSVILILAAWGHKRPRSWPRSKDVVRGTTQIMLGCDVDWIDLAQDRNQRRTGVSAA